MLHGAINYSDQQVTNNKLPLLLTPEISVFALYGVGTHLGFCLNKYLVTSTCLYGRKEGRKILCLGAEAGVVVSFGTWSDLRKFQCV